MMKIKLKACPFCGSSNVSTEDHRLRFSVSCGDCSACILGDSVPEPETEDNACNINTDELELSAINKWNKRSKSGEANQNN